MTDNQDNRTTRSFHGTGEQAIDWAVNYSLDKGCETYAFLHAWQQGNLDEWPEFYAWLDGKKS